MFVGLMFIAAIVGYMIGKWSASSRGYCPYRENPCTRKDDPELCPHFDESVCPYWKGASE